jgi:hypothetical protein
VGRTPLRTQKVPETDRAVVTGGGKRVAVGAKGDSVDLLGMTAKRPPELRPRADLSESNRSILTTRGERP